MPLIYARRFFTCTSVGVPVFQPRRLAFSWFLRRRIGSRFHTGARPDYAYYLLSLSASGILWSFFSCSPHLPLPALPASAKILIKTTKNVTSWVPQHSTIVVGRSLALERKPAKGSSSRSITVSTDSSISKNARSIFRIVRCAFVTVPTESCVNMNPLRCTSEHAHDTGRGGAQKITSLFSARATNGIPGTVHVTTETRGLRHDDIDLQ